MSQQLPTGTVTFLFTDVERSTVLWETDPGMHMALARHDEILRSSIEDGGGYVFTTAGDSFAAAFASAPDAARAATAAQEALTAEPWETAEPLRVRMAVHTGTAEERDGDYFGPALNRSARLLGVGHGGQILLSESAAVLVGDGSPDELIDLGEHRLKDLTEPERIFQLGDTPGERFPPLRSLEAYPNNLPLQLTSFIGRDAQLEEIARLIDEHRLLTLTGVGGSGKTRLALQAAGAVIERFPDGAWLIELAPVSDPGMIPAAVIDGLGISVRGSTTPSEALKGFLADRTLLLVLDNCEHLLDEAARLSDEVLHAAPAVHIVATSREGLAVAGERLLQVPSLEVGGDTEDWMSASESEAVRLFSDRAVEVQPGFALNEDTVPAVVHMCRRLDGMPLAIELAAAQVRILPVEQIAERLDDRFRLLTGRSRTALPRQQTLLATVEWSYDLLTEGEKLLFDRLAVFRGGFTLEAAEAVCSGEGLDESEVLMLLTHLVDKSLVVSEGAALGPARFQMLETLPQFSLERLSERQATDAVRRRHAAYFLAFAEEAEPALETAAMAEWLDRLEADHDNMRAALGWMIDSEAGVDALRMTVALSVWFWFIHRHHEEAHQWHEQTLAATEGASDDLLATALAKASMQATRVGELERATEMANEALRRAKASGNRRAEIVAHWTHGDVAGQGRYDFEVALASYEQSFQLAEDAGDPIWMTRLLFFIGSMELGLGRLEEAAFHAQQSLDVARTTGWPMGIAEAAGLVALLALESGEFDRVDELSTEALSIEKSLGDPFGTIAEYETLTLAARLRGDAERGLNLATEGMAAVGRRIDSVGPVPLLIELAACALVLGRVVEAIDAVLDALAIIRGTMYRWTAAKTFSRAAAVLLANDEVKGAVTAFAVSERLFEESAQPVRWNKMEFEAGLAYARDAIGAEAFNEAWKTGWATEMDPAVDQTIEWVHDLKAGFAADDASPG